ncbi:hypothetical protein [Methanobacterium alcaliphilum]|uniref:hypothetical protein n=1 Tax=Methanobacterium alcaliphilum TaxID=392018 RepID=UPI00200B1AFE|nr:hypothetical protein [Methanobacterium alcaliphilum]MCK9150589.1 hypothetical protein [Methanobacterium alcaliphilum]
MKMKLFPLFLMVILAFSVAQPIFAANPQLEDTKIAGKNGAPINDITVSPGETIGLQARLYWYWYTVDSVNTSWIPQICRYLDFYVYKSNANGTNGELVWSDTAITNFFTANANPDEFKLNEKGTYNLVIKYEGKLKHCQANAKIYVQ